MNSLVADMTAEDPATRPTSDEVVARFETIRKSLSTWKLRTRIIARNEIFPLETVFRIVPHWVRRIYFIITRTPALPSPKK